MVFVTFEDGKKAWIDLDPYMTSVTNLLEQIEEETGFPAVFQRVFHNGVPLSSAISDLNVHRESSLTVKFNINVDLVEMQRGEPEVGIQERRPKTGVLGLFDTKPPENYVPGIGRGATGFDDVDGVPIVYVRRGSIGSGTPENRRASDAPDILDEESSPRRKKAKVSIEGNQERPNTQTNNKMPHENYIPGFGRGTTGFEIPENPRASGAAYILDEELLAKVANEGNQTLDFFKNSPKNYIAGLGRGKTGPEIGLGLERLGLKSTENSSVKNLDKSRLFLRSFILSSPNHTKAWIAAARVEEMSGNIEIAKEIIEKGCKVCSSSADLWVEDLWVEACRFSTPEQAKVVVAKGLEAIPKSLKLWIQATKLEKDVSGKRRVLMEGVKTMPECYTLWDMAVDLAANKDEVRTLLRTAAACGPQRPEIYITLAKYEPYSVAKKVLELARDRLPKEVSLWVAASSLEGANGYHNAAEDLIIECLRMVNREELIVNQGTWIDFAQAAREAGSVATSRAIYSHAV